MARCPLGPVELADFIALNHAQCSVKLTIIRAPTFSRTLVGGKADPVRDISKNHNEWGWGAT